MTDFSPVSLAGYGLKDHSEVPIDLNRKDGDCVLKTYKSLFSMRNPDTIETIRYNDKVYVVTANEGNAYSFGDWDEEFRADRIFRVRPCVCWSVSRSRYEMHLTSCFRGMNSS